MSDVQNLYQRRNAAKKAVFKHEFKKVQGEGLKFKYLPVEIIKPVVEEAWNDVGIVADVGPLELEDSRDQWDVDSQYGGGKTRWFHCKGSLEITLVNIDNPEDKVSFTVWGEAKDNSDKVINKVYTSAMKNFYKIEFNISEGPKDDTDAIQSDADLEEKPKVTIPKDDPLFSKKKTVPAKEEPKEKPKEEPKEELKQETDSTVLDDKTINEFITGARTNTEHNELITAAFHAEGVLTVQRLKRATREVLYDSIRSKEGLA